MNALVLLIPLLLIRYGLPLLLDKSALSRAAHYPSFPKNTIGFMYVYQLTTILLIIIPVFLTIHFSSMMNYIGLGIYLVGILLLVIATFDFSKPNNQQLHINGLYKYSRNPMYVAYFLYFLGCVLLTDSIILGVVLIAFQVSCHWLIKAEEVWCMTQFGEEYKIYMKKVRRYL